MEDTIFEWLLNIPQTIASFGEWLITPLKKGFINISPLELLGIGGVSVIIFIIGTHIVRLFL